MTLRQEDRAISARVRAVRIEAGLTQQQFARLIDVSYQQAHKYETGITRISAGMLSKIAQALDRPVTSFYPDGEAVPVIPTHQRAVREIGMLLETMSRTQIRALLLVARAFANENGRRLL
jgi:transcriptional regulator with XRE-family HTH domain